ncbi:MAG: aldehyde dehydrogenase family protein, partial [Bacteroidia bacterium]
SGQTCIAPDYVFVHSSIKNEFIDKVKVEIAKSDFSTQNENYVQIINDRNVERLAKLIDPSKVIQGGDVDRPNRIISPTVLDGVTFQDAIMQEEIFGPLMAVIEYDDLDWAINKVKKRPKPLACYIYSTDNKVKKKILHELSFGGGGINESVMHISNPHFGYGGVGESGLGSYHGKYGFDDFSHYKSIIEKPSWFEPNFKYYKRTAVKYSFIRKLMKL